MFSRVATLIVVLAGTLVAQTAPQAPSAPERPIATFPAAFNVGNFPIGMVSDGTNIWVANAASGTRF